MGTSGGQTQTSTTKLPSWAEPYAHSAIKWSRREAMKPFNAFEGQRFADLNADQMQGLDMTRQRALAGSPVMNEANRNLEATLRGDYLSPDSNPYLQNTVNQALGDVTSKVNSQFAGNNYGGTAHQEWLGRNLAETALPIYNQNYQQERGRQMQANLFAPQAAQSDYADLQALLGVGDVLQGQEQQGLDFGYQQFQQEQAYPQQQLDAYLRAIYGYPGSETTAPNPYQSNKAASAIGGAAAGAGLGGALGGAAAGAKAGSVIPGWGTAIGAGVGLLAGLYG